MVDISEQETGREAPFFIYKADEEKHLVFGWASVSVTVEGEQLEDRQQDMIDPADLEEAVYEYVLKFRDSGEEHISTLRKKGKLVESCVFTEEKQRAMGIPPGIVPVGWWIGFKIEDEAAWQKVKDGTYRMFSIEGQASREAVVKTAAVAKTFNEILKFNPYHDRLGRFASADGVGSGENAKNILTVAQESGNLKSSSYSGKKVIGKNGGHINAEDFPSIFDPEDGTKVRLEKGTKMVKIHTFAGKGTKKPLRIEKKLIKKYGGKPGQWQHTNGIGTIIKNGKRIKADIHWFQAVTIGIWGAFIKRKRF